MASPRGGMHKGLLVVFDLLALDFEFGVKELACHVSAIGADGVWVSGDDRSDRRPEAGLTLRASEPMSARIVSGPELAAVRFCGRHVCLSGKADTRYT